MYYKDINIINNSSLACFLLIYFIDEYKKISIDGTNPDLMKLLLVLPLVWHKTSRDIIKKKQLNTPLNMVIQNNPSIKSNLKQRISEYTGPTLQGLNLAVSSGLLTRLVEHNEIYLKINFTRWPSGIKKKIPDDMTKTIVRLANWFYYIDAASLYALLLGKSL
ncbi:hypothetical protein A6X29_000406 [Salmonella enterica subsp. enterica serovar Cerro]|uniref:Uncharacterized protein n=2 Tax=Salmonella enterica TaxID=28901 RepID=A0A657I137_SALET|nr:hypothetical protein [Salmonella enterica]EAC0927702.1 hypothetical protein [Salmonella enterica subsp. enterica serovar Lisboa]ECJ8273819.1 hypothetical protein [Salmonella enterica subsp. enterica]ECQ6420231.1 hypothetical protein [Salmonella enterica subsp. enterica serovar Amsterdam]EDE2462906.1 hypothetical protein [Salmonella enterica subsp. enterica serovar Pensacola]EDV6529028.1 hypothetical protein [Salmonella enterica subsp. enterica serovar Cerro]EHX6160093.1 hypothetical protei